MERGKGIPRLLHNRRRATPTPPTFQLSLLLLLLLLYFACCFHVVLGNEEEFGIGSALSDNNKVGENLGGGEENEIAKIATANGSLGDIEDEDDDRDCGNAWGESGEHTVEMCEFWMEGVLVTVTGTIGLIGNTLSVIILLKPGMRNAFNMLLVSLSTMDNFFIIIAIGDYSIARAFGLRTDLFVYLFPYVIYPLHQITFCAAIFLTVALAVERYIAVCNPIAYRNALASHTVWYRTMGYVIPSLVASVVINIPKYFESTLDYYPVGQLPTLLDNGTTVNVTQYQVHYRVTDLRNDPNYIRYYINWTRFLATGLGPMAALVFFNYSIFRGIRMTHERTKKNKGKASEMNLAAILMCIVFIFLICNFPRIMLNVHEFFMTEDIIACEDAFRPPVWFLCVTSFNHWLLIVNASFNFLIYCSVGTNFKEVIVASSKCCVKIFGNVNPAGHNGNGDAESLSEAATSRLRTKRAESPVTMLVTTRPSPSTIEETAVITTEIMKTVNDRKDEKTEDSAEETTAILIDSGGSPKTVSAANGVTKAVALCEHKAI